jgi:pectin methylesterase-like acyl-CoA thioesterase
MLSWENSFGTKSHKTITQAIVATLNKCSKRYIIKVRKTTYKENVEVGK